MNIKKNIPLILILFSPVILMLTSYSLFYLDRSDVVDVEHLLGVDSHGTIVKPAILIDTLSIYDKNDTPLFIPYDEKKWHLFIWQRENCTSCVENLYQSQQMQIALGKYSHQLKRYHLRLDRETKGSHSIKNTHEQYFISNDIFDRLPSQVTESDYFLVDKRGWVMMTYAEHFDERLIIKDLKHLFKYAQ